MPTYEYKCDNCGHEFDFYQLMKDDKLTKCPDCGKETLRRLIGTGSGLIFKGSGFYLTDYKNKPAEKTALSPSESKTETKKSDSPASGNTEPSVAKDKISADSPSSDSASETKSKNKSGSSSGNTGSADPNTKKD